MPRIATPTGTPDGDMLPLPPASDDSDDDLVTHIHPDLVLQQQEEEEQPAPESACLWFNCGKMFSRLEELVQHIHKEHVGTSKSTYKCMWDGCGLFGVTRTSRFALIGHIRSHTGERPFTCKLPECDKSFTRSDALTKHMRVVHGIEPNIPANRTQKKRKRDESDAEEEPTLETGPEDDEHPEIDEDDSYNPKTRRRSRKGKPLLPLGIVKIEGVGGTLPTFASHDADPQDWTDDDSDWPEEAVDPETGLINGCRPSKARYLICKAKYRYAVGEHERLLERLKFEQDEVKRLQGSKDEVLNDLLRHQFGAGADQIIAPVSVNSN